MEGAGTTFTVMARYRLFKPAKADIAESLHKRADRHGRDARLRYRGLPSVALRRVATDPQGWSASDPGELLAGLRSFRIRHSRNDSLEAPVGVPIHVIFSRAVGTGVSEVVCLLRERMDPVGASVSTSGDPGPVPGGRE